VIGTYAAVAAVCAASLTIGQAAIGLCGWRRWSWLSPALGLALVCAVCWGTVRLPGDGALSAAAVAALGVASVPYLWGRLEDGGEALAVAWPVAVVALLAASAPFIVEGHFGILGTSFNPDMSQHLLAADRLANGHSSELLRQGYPLGPHAIVVALHKGLGIGLVQAFSGLTVAVAVLASLTSLTAFSNLRPIPRTAGALAVGLAYVVASYFAQGAFKETMQALWVLAFALSLREATRAWRDVPFRFLPAALLAVGSVYTYSFPGLIWLFGAVAIWAGIESVRGRSARRGPAPLRPALLSLLLFAVLVAPELGRMVDFQSFETFDPNGPGLGNLFGQISPFEALGIWPSGDFRLAPGDGAVPAVAYYLGAAFATALLIHGIVRCWRRGEHAVLAALAAAAVAYAAARAGGTPYTAAKAIEIAAPLAALTILLPLLDPSPGRLSRAADKGAPLAPPVLVAGLFVLVVGACSALALANAPVGPTSYSPALTGMRPILGEDSTLVLASDRLLDDQHGAPFIAWELRGARVCIEPESEAGGAPPGGVRFVIDEGRTGSPPYPGLRIRRAAKPYVLWEVGGQIAAHGPCPLIAVRQARQGSPH
jgi:hypothetical protein